MNQGLRERLADMVGEQSGAPRAELLADKSFADMGLDSLSVVEISIFLEEQLRLDFQGKVAGHALPRNLTELEKVVFDHLPTS